MRRLCQTVAVLLFVVVPCCGQHLGARQQWQPQTEKDPRLQQALHLEIIGRAAVTGLPLLVEKTGVSLRVAPEDRATVGERKLTVIAKGCTLKDVMVQLQEVLQECHWDVDLSADPPVYLLHRNAGVDFQGLKRRQEQDEQDAANRRAVRLARLEDGRRALKMTPEELAELEKTDPILARAVREPQMRAAMEALYSLPAEQRQTFERDGSVALTYDQAPPQLRKAADLAMQWSLDEEEHRPAQRTAEMWAPQGARDEKFVMEAQALAQMKRWRDKPSRVLLRVDDGGLDLGFGVRLLITVPTGSEFFGTNDAMLPPSKISTDEGSGAYLRMLVATGAAANPIAAMEIVQKTERKGFREDWERTEERRKRQWVVPTDLVLLKTIALGDRQFKDLAEWQQFVANETGLSIVSDSFTSRGCYIPDELRGGVPLWQLLYRVGEDSFGRSIMQWRKAGSALVFHADNWYDLAQGEVPELLLQEYQGKVQTQGQFSLDDVAAFAVALGDRHPQYTTIPDDLARAGLSNAIYARWALTFYASLSPDQLGKARSEAGLLYSAMTIAQRELVQEAIGHLQPEFGPAPEEAPQAVLFITDASDTRGSGERARVLLSTRFRLRFTEKDYNEVVTRVQRPETSTS